LLLAQQKFQYLLTFSPLLKAAYQVNCVTDMRTTDKLESTSDTILSTKEDVSQKSSKLVGETAMPKVDDSIEDSDEGIHDTFPHKLYRMLMETDKNGQSTIVSFNDTGTCFLIHKPGLFISDIMPRYFTTSKMASFQRQLNLYGFRRIAGGVDKGGYWHEHFIRGRKSMCKNVRRKKTSSKLSPSASSFISQDLMVANMHPHAMNVRQMIAKGQLSAGHSIPGTTQHVNPVLAAALMMEQQRHQTELLAQLVIRRQHERAIQAQFQD
jgi:hypothetical protein